MQNKKDKSIQYDIHQKRVYNNDGSLLNKKIK